MAKFLSALFIISAVAAACVMSALADSEKASVKAAAAKRSYDDFFGLKDDNYPRFRKRNYDDFFGLSGDNYQRIRKRNYDDFFGLSDSDYPRFRKRNYADFFALDGDNYQRFRKSSGASKKRSAGAA